MDIQPFKDRYASILKRYAQDRQERYLAEAAELGRQLVQANVPPEDIAEIHADALLGLADESPDRPLSESVERISTPLTEMLMAYGLAFRRQLDQRKQAEEQIRGLAKFPSEDPYPVLRVARDGTVLYANLAASSLVGTWGPDQWKHLVAEASDSGSKKQIEVEHQGRIFLFSVVPIPETDYLNLYGTDITERKRAEEALRESKEHLRGVFDASEEIIFTKNKEGYYTQANDAFFKLFERPKEEIVGKKDEDVFSKPEAEYLRIRDLEVFQTGRVQRTEDTLRVRGQKRVFRTTKVPLRNSAGEIVELCGFADDITERKKVEQEIENLAKFPSENPNPVLRISADGIVLYCNQAALLLLNAWKCKVGLPVPDHWRAFTAQALNDKRPRQTEVQLADRMYSLTFAPVQSGGYVNVYGLDITNRKHAELELFRRQAQLKSLASQLTLAEERERRRIAADLHDRVSQSLAFARLRLDTLCKTQPLPGQARILKELSNLLGRTIKQTKSLTFDLSSPELYEMGFTAAVSEWLAENVEGQYDIKTKFEDDGQPGPMAEDVRILLFRNVRELLTNIIKHAHARNVKVSLSSRGSQMTVRVQDDGMGFDPAQTAKHAARRGEFGLFSIRERLEELGGSLEINSSHGKGCTVTMTAPLQEKQSCRE